MPKNCSSTLTTLCSAIWSRKKIAHLHIVKTLQIDSCHLDLILMELDLYKIASWLGLFSGFIAHQNKPNLLEVNHSRLVYLTNHTTLPRLQFSSLLGVPGLSYCLWSMCLINVHSTKCTKCATISHCIMWSCPLNKLLGLLDEVELGKDKSSLLPVRCTEISTWV